MPRTSSVSTHHSIRFAVWLVVSGAVILTGLLGSTKAWAQAVICSGNSSIPISPSILQLSRTAPVSYEVALCTTPGADVVVSVLPAESGKIIVSPAVLTFTTPVSQSVSVSIDPGVGETEAFTIAIHHSVASLDPDYDWGTTNTPDVIATYLAGNVVGRVFADFNGNLVYDAGETPLAGAGVALAGASAPPDQVTDSSGQYRFLGMQPGPYTTTLTVPAGFVSALPAQRIVNVGVGVNTIVDFPLIIAGIIQGAVFEDFNGNGLQDGGEPGVAGVAVLRSGGGLPDAGTTTVAGGGYSITTAAAGSYTVTLTTPSGYNSASAPQRPVVLVEGGSAQANFILQQQGAIEGVVFVDRDGDEQLGPGEGGLPGVSVSLSPGGTTTTASAGHYRFSGLSTGEYNVSFSMPAGYGPVSLTSRAVSLAQPGDSATVGFAVQQLGTIQGIVFDDSNANGMREIGEAGIPGVTVTLESNDTQTTDENGRYTFTDALPGTYRVAINVPMGFTALTLTAFDVTVGETAGAFANFALHTPDTISGRVFVDFNSNDLFDPDDIPLPGVDVYLLTETGDGVVVTATTDANGGYQFTGVDAGTYNVTIQNGGDSRYTPISPDPVFVVLLAGHSTGANFIVLPDNTIAGMGIPGALVTASTIAAQGEVGGVATWTTYVNSRGYYFFLDLAPGAYRLTFIPPPGFTAVPSTMLVSLPLGGAARADFLGVVDGTIEGVVFADLNADGIRQRGEPPVAGATIILRNKNLAIISQTTGTSVGRYRFAPVASGDYIVQPAPIAGFVIAPGVDVSLTPALPGALADVAMRRIGALSGRVYIYQTNDPSVASPLANVAVTLDGPGGLQVMASSVNGAYQFPDLVAGSYVVSVPTPAGLFHFTPSSVGFTIGASTLDPVVNFAFARRGSSLYLPQMERNVLPYPDKQ